MAKWMRFAVMAAAAATFAAAGLPASAADYDDGYEDAYVVERPLTVHDVAIALGEQGFVEWDYIKWRHGVWIVDDARRIDGREFDLRLDPVTLAVIWSDRD